MRRCIFILMICVFVTSWVEAASMKEVDSVRERIYAWSKAWENKNFDAYMSFYSPAFRSGELDYDGWFEKKKELFQNPEDISLKISDLWVFLEGNRAQARFIQHYHCQSRTDVGEKTINLIQSAGKWKILSEEWELLESAPLSSDERKTASTPRRPQREVKDTVYETIGTEDNVPFSETCEVRSIQFQIGREWENVFVNLNTFSIPEFFTLDGDKPRIVVDVGGVSNWKGKPKMPVNGKYIRQIRTHLHKNTEKLRIVLDLEPDKDYTVQQIFDMTTNIYSIEVREAKKKRF